MAQRGHNQSTGSSGGSERRCAEVCIEWIKTMGEHSFLLKLHLEHEAFLRQTIAQLRQRICEETDDNARGFVEQYKKDIEQELKHEEQELRKLHVYDSAGGNKRDRD